MTQPLKGPRRRAWLRGYRAETLAAWWLRLKGYRVLARRLSTPVGELDLVVRRGDTVAVVEVKARPVLEAAAEAMRPAQRQRIARAAAWLLAARPGLSRCRLRFDLVLVIPGRLPRHIRDAWRPDWS